MRLTYYAHRYTDPSFQVSQDNWVRATFRFATLGHELAKAGEVLWAPWLNLANVRRRESLVWPVIIAAIQASDCVLLDLDGAPASPGMERERAIATQAGVEVVEFGIDSQQAVDQQPEESTT